jgi:hypothetical protein
MAPSSLIQSGQGFHPRKPCNADETQDDTPTRRTTPKVSLPSSRLLPRAILVARSARQTGTAATGVRRGQRHRCASMGRSRLDPSIHIHMLPICVVARHAYAPPLEATRRCPATPAAAAGALPRQSTPPCRPRTGTSTTRRPRDLRLLATPVAVCRPAPSRTACRRPKRASVTGPLEPRAGPHCTRHYEPPRKHTGGGGISRRPPHDVDPTTGGLDTVVWAPDPSSPMTNARRCNWSAAVVLGTHPDFR